MCSEVKKGSCLRYESLDHMAWVTIWASSIAASAGLSQPLLDSTSTQAWIRRTACKHTTWVKYRHRKPIPIFDSSFPLGAQNTTNLYLAQDLLCVRLQLSAQLHPGEVGLQQQVGLHVGIVELRVVQFVGHLLCQLKYKNKLFHNQFQHNDLVVKR